MVHPVITLQLSSVMDTGREIPKPLVSMNQVTNCEVTCYHLNGVVAECMIAFFVLVGFSNSCHTLHRVVLNGNVDDGTRVNSAANDPIESTKNETNQVFALVSETEGCQMPNAGVEICTNRFRV